MSPHRGGSNEHYPSRLRIQYSTVQRGYCRSPVRPERSHKRYKSSKPETLSGRTSARLSSTTPILLKQTSCWATPYVSYCKQGHLRGFPHQTYHALIPHNDVMFLSHTERIIPLATIRVDDTSHTVAAKHYVGLLRAHSPLKPPENLHEPCISYNYDMLRLCCTH